MAPGPWVGYSYLFLAKARRFGKGVAAVNFGVDVLASD
jgi:hypothetical protein